MKGISPKKRQLVYEKFNGKCAYCGKILLVDNSMFWKPHPDAFVIDHVTPKTKGGNNHIDNLLPSCNYCNSVKYNKSITQFKEYFFSKLTKQPLFNQEQKEYLLNYGLDLFSFFNDCNFYFEKIQKGIINE